MLDIQYPHFYISNLKGYLFLYNIQIKELLLNNNECHNSKMTMYTKHINDYFLLVTNKIKIKGIYI